jgi:phosphohistidine phosphatase
VRAGEIEPDEILCSSARRTRETIEGVLPGRPFLVDHTLYAASGGDVIERLRQVDASRRSVMVVGHNPAMQTIVLRLACDEGNDRPSSELAAPLSDIARKFPTGALATLEFDCPWADLAPGCATLRDYVRPKALG